MPIHAFEYLPGGGDDIFVAELAVFVQPLTTSPGMGYSANGTKLLASSLCCTIQVRYIPGHT